jgi:hypothetical protein
MSIKQTEIGTVAINKFLHYDTSVIVLSYILKRPLCINNLNFDCCVNFENVISDLPTKHSRSFKNQTNGIERGLN